MMLTGDAFAVLALALLIDGFVGDPDALWRRLPHPVALIGNAISVVERWANADTLRQTVRRLNGVLFLLVLLATAVGLGLGLEAAFRALPGGPLLLGAMASILIAQRSLVRHVEAVAVALRDGLDAGRGAVAMIVGRNPDHLDAHGVARAAIESNAENFSDGVVAPAFWFAVAGLPGLLAYKALNTADSMIGHRTPRYQAFGWASARFDDLANYLPARLAGLLIVLAAPAAGGSMRTALIMMRRDARRLASPNAGLPEAAMAGALSLALAGPRHYGAGQTEDAWLNPTGRPAADVADIARSVRIVWTAWALLLVVTLAIAAATL